MSTLAGLIILSIAFLNFFLLSLAYCYRSCIKIVRWFIVLLLVFTILLCFTILVIHDKGTPVIPGFYQDFKGIINILVFDPAFFIISGIFHFFLLTLLQLQTFKLDKYAGAFDFFREKKNFLQFWLFTGLLLGLLLLVAAANFTLCLFLLELCSLILIVFFVMTAGSAQQLNVCLNYFLINAFVSGITYILLFFVSLFKYENFDTLIYANGFRGSIITGILFSFLLFFKLGFFPVHIIQFPVYEKTPWFFFFFILNGYKAVLFYLFVKFWLLFKPIYPVFFAVGISSALIGSILLITVFTLRSLLFFSSIFTYGCALIFLSVNSGMLALTFILSYSLVNLVLCFLFMFLELFYGKPLEHIDDLEFSDIHFSTFLLPVFWFLCGLPPTVLFFFKTSLLSSVFIHWGLGISIFFIIILILSTVAYFRLLVTIFSKTDLSHLPIIIFIVSFLGMIVFDATFIGIFYLISYCL